jgi:hypothetical protein
MLMADASKSIRRPNPPMVDVDYGGKVKQEPNPNHPDYVEALRQYTLAQNNKALEAAIILGVRVTVDKERVAELRQDLDGMNFDLPHNDKVVYITRILCETAHDLEVLRDAILRKSQPTEAAVAEAVARFPADVQES